MSARRALVTGASGQDGSYLVELLVAQGYDVTGLVRDPDDRPLPHLASVRDQIPLLHGDRDEPAPVGDPLSAGRPHELYRLAAPTSVPPSWDDPAHPMARIAG